MTKLFLLFAAIFFSLTFLIALLINQSNIDARFSPKIEKDAWKMPKKRCIKIKEYEYLLEIKLVITQHQKSMDSFMLMSWIMQEQRYEISKRWRLEKQMWPEIRMFVNNAMCLCNHPPFSHLFLFMAAKSLRSYYVMG